MGLKKFLFPPKTGIPHFIQSQTNPPSGGFLDLGHFKKHNC